MVYKFPVSPSQKKTATDDLFQEKLQSDLRQNAPLADRMRAQNLDDYVGQQHLLGASKPLRRQIENDALTSLIFWGPPGVGKTTLAKVIAERTQFEFTPLSAIGWSTADFRVKIGQALDRRKFHAQRTLLFIDEIHRLNKAQQDQLLPYLEKGVVTLIGATTENPSFELNSAILSRCQVYVLNQLSESELRVLAKRALQDETSGLGKFHATISAPALGKLTALANGDARILYNLLERAVMMVGEKGKISPTIVSELAAGIAFVYDKNGEEHYNLISALHKSMRDSDADAALYWLQRMLAAGEDPLYIIRRVIRFASEDIGAADPHALPLTVAALEAVRFIGLPEAENALGQAVVYCARAPKSNDIYQAQNQLRELIKETGNLPVPLHLRNAPTKLMQDLGYKKDYKYAPDDPEGAAQQEHLPEKIRGRRWLKS